MKEHNDLCTSLLLRPQHPRPPHTQTPPPAATTDSLEIPPSPAERIDLRSEIGENITPHQHPLQTQPDGSVGNGSDMTRVRTPPRPFRLLVDDEEEASTPSRTTSDNTLAINHDDTAQQEDNDLDQTSGGANRAAINRDHLHRPRTICICLHIGTVLYMVGSLRYRLIKHLCVNLHSLQCKHTLYIVSP